MRSVSLAIALCVLAFPARSAGVEAYAGNYSLEGRILAIAEWEVEREAPHVLAFTDLSSGRFGMLTEVAPDDFVLRQGAMAGPEEAHLRFTRTRDQVTGLTFSATSQRPKSARRLPMRRMETSVSSGGSMLPATLVLPPGRGPFPAIVIVPAGRVGRTAAATFPNFFLSLGFAVLTYERPGERVSFEASAADAIAAAELLRGRSDIDGKRIGLWGHSQGGWLSIIAASRSRTIAFVIDHSGMFVPAWQQELYRVAAEGSADGRSPVDVANAVSFEAQLMQVAHSGTGWNELTSRLQSGGAWLDLVYKPSSLEELQAIWRADFSFDPRPFAAGVSQPVLALFGGLDRSTPIESAANLERAMPSGSRLTEVFFPTADHAFLDATTGGNAEIPTLTHFVPGMFDTMRKWLRSEVLGRRSI